MRVAVIGGGIQGTCVALELARREIDVDLIETKSSPMEGASRHSEGKIHLGFVYANDASLRTADLQMRGAAVFGRLMREWLGTEFDDIPVSTAFNYAVHERSLIPPERLARPIRRSARGSAGDAPTVPTSASKTPVRSNDSPRARSRPYTDRL